MAHFMLHLLILAFTQTGQSGDTTRYDAKLMTLFDFNSDSEPTWQVVNDGVMGGRSSGFVSVEEGTLRFTGTLVTQGGGFTSIRAEKVVDLDSYAGLELRVRGGGRTFEVQVDDGTRRQGRVVSRRAPFDTSEDWQVVRVPFRELRASVFGMQIRAPEIDLKNVKSIGLFILDGKDGPFSLEVDEIRAYKEYRET